ncbi:hypothetical protein Nmel_010337 [Mimus melanotis]
MLTEDSAVRNAQVLGCFSAIKANQVKVTAIS